MLKGTQHMEEEEDDDDDDDLRTRRRSIFFGTYMCVYIYIKKSSLGLLYHCDDIIFQYTYSIVTVDISYWYSQWLSIWLCPYDPPVRFPSNMSCLQSAATHASPPPPFRPARAPPAPDPAARRAAAAAAGGAPSGATGQRGTWDAPRATRRDGDVRWISHGEYWWIMVIND